MKWLKLILILGIFSHVARGRQEAPANSPATETKPKIIRIRLSEATTVAQLKHRVQPKYPANAKKNHVQGTVRLHVVIGTDGKVMSADVVSGDPLLTESAMDAVRQWEYQPAKLNGQLVEVDSVVAVVYALKP